MKNTKEEVLDALEGNSIKTQLKEWIGGMKKGETINYWDIADEFDEYDEKSGGMNYDIVAEYDLVLEELESAGIIKYKKDKDGNDNIIVKR